MKQITKLITIISLIGFISSCRQNCPDPSTKTTYVDRGYLPYIIPYSDTSTRLFLKNGKDTLLFKSQGLKQSFDEGSTTNTGDCVELYKNENLSLRMAASDTDFFDIYYLAKMDGVSVVKISINNRNTTYGYSYLPFKNPIHPVNSVYVLNIKYDTIVKLPEPDMEVFIKPRYSVLKLKTSRVTYELIK